MTTIVEATSSAAAQYPVIADSDVAPFNDYIVEIMRRLNILQSRLSTAQILQDYSHATGGFVKLLPEYRFLPVLIGQDNRPVLLYKFLETLDEHTDYDLLKQDFPALSYAQIDGAISFLKKIAQFNFENIDLDALEDEEMLLDQELIKSLRIALDDKEIARVYHRDQ